MTGRAWAGRGGGDEQGMVIVDSLKTARERVEEASRLLGEAAKETYLPSEFARQSVRAELAKIRFHMSMLSRSATVLRAVANRRKPPLQQERKPRHTT